MAKKHELTLTSILYMLLVIFIHIAAEGVTEYRTDSLLFVGLCSAHRLSSFVVQGFLFLSGVKLFLPRQNDTFSYPHFLVSRLRRVVLPYIAVFAVFVLYFTLTGRLAFDLPYYVRECLVGGLVGHFYYVAIQCQFYILVPLWRLIVKRSSMPLACLTSLIIMLICRTALPELVMLTTGFELTYNSRLFTTFLFYFVCGCFCGANYERFRELLRTRRTGLTVFAAVCGAIDCVLILVIRWGIYYPTWADDFHVLYCTGAILCTLSYAVKLADLAPHLAESSIVRLISSASYNVYLIHPLFIFVTDSLLDRMGILSISARLVLRAVTVYTVSVGLCVLLEKGCQGIKVYIGKRRRA